MRDYIDRQAAIAYAISGRIRALPTSEDGEDWIRTAEVRQSLLSVPSAEVEPVKRGKWILLEEEIGLYECSVCGHKILRAECNYCPNCGAKMEPISASTENGRDVEA